MKAKIGLLVFALFLYNTSSAVQLTTSYQHHRAGWEHQGADILATNLDDHPNADLIFMVYDKTNEFRYFTRKNVSNNYTNFTQDDYSRFIPGVGDVQGAGMAITQLDSSSSGPDLILMGYEKQDLENRFRYRVAYDLDENGTPRDVGGIVTVPGVGWEAQGADVVITNLDDNPAPEMILMAYDNPARKNSFRYKVGFNLQKNGTTNDWTQSFEVPGVSWEADGAGAEIINWDGNEHPDLLLMAYDAPPGGRSEIRYRVALDIGKRGSFADWTDVQTTPGFGKAQGAGVTVFNVFNIHNSFSDPDRMAIPEMIFMVNEYIPNGGNRFRIRTIDAPRPVAKIFLELDKSESVNWPHQYVVRRNGVFTLPMIFAQAGIEMEVMEDYSFPRVVVSNTASDEGGSYIELIDEMHRAGDRIHIHGMILEPGEDGHTNGGSQGLQYRDFHRDAFYVTLGPLNIEEEGSEQVEKLEPYRAALEVRVMAHEIGHALLLCHFDGDAHNIQYGQPARSPGASIMNSRFENALDLDHWHFVWSAESLNKIYRDAQRRWRPGNNRGSQECWRNI